MSERVTRRLITFPHPFPIEGFDDQRAGTYEVEKVEETIDSLSFLAYRLVSASLVLPLSDGARHSYQLVRIAPSLVRAAEAAEQDGCGVQHESGANATISG